MSLFDAFRRSTRVESPEEEPAQPAMNEVDVVPYLRGALRLVRTDEGLIQPFRFTPRQMELLERINRAKRAIATSGIAIDFLTDGDTVSFECRVVHTLDSSSRLYAAVMEHEGVLGDAEDGVIDGIDMVAGGLRSYTTAVTDGTVTLSFDNPDHDLVEVRIFLPYMMGVSVGELACNGRVELAPERGYLLALGDSITQGFVVGCPSLTYPALVAGALGLDLVNQGIAGHMFDRRTLAGIGAMRARPPRAIVCAYGTNDWARKPSRELIRRGAERYLAQLVKAFPGVPTYVLSPLWRADEAEPVPAGVPLTWMGELLEELCGAHEQLRFVDGYNTIPKNPVMLADGRLHPGSVDAGLVADVLIERMGADGVGADAGEGVVSLALPRVEEPAGGAAGAGAGAEASGAEGLAGEGGAAGAGAGAAADGTSGGDDGVSAGGERVAGEAPGDGAGGDGAAELEAGRAAGSGGDASASGGGSAGEAGVGGGSADARGLGATGGGFAGEDDHSGTGERDAAGGDAAGARGLGATGGGEVGGADVAGGGFAGEDGYSGAVALDAAAGGDAAAARGLDGDAAAWAEAERAEGAAGGAGVGGGSADARRLGDDDGAAGVRSLGDAAGVSGGEAADTRGLGDGGAAWATERVAKSTGEGGYSGAGAPDAAGVGDGARARGFVDATGFGDADAAAWAEAERAGVSAGEAGVAGDGTERTRWSGGAADVGGAAGARGLGATGGGEDGGAAWAAERAGNSAGEGGYSGAGAPDAAGGGDSNGRARWSSDAAGARGLGATAGGEDGGAAWAAGRSGGSAGEGGYSGAGALDAAGGDDARVRGFVDAAGGDDGTERTRWSGDAAGVGADGGDARAAAERAGVSAGEAGVGDGAAGARPLGDGATGEAEGDGGSARDGSAGKAADGAGADETADLSAVASAVRGRRQATARRASGGLRGARPTRASLLAKLPTIDAASEGAPADGVPVAGGDEPAGAVPGAAGEAAADQAAFAQAGDRTEARVPVAGDEGGAAAVAVGEHGADGDASARGYEDLDEPFAFDEAAAVADEATGDWDGARAADGLGGDAGIDAPSPAFADAGAAPGIDEVSAAESAARASGGDGSRGVARPEGDPVAGGLAAQVGGGWERDAAAAGARASAVDAAVASAGDAAGLALGAGDVFADEGADAATLVDRGDAAGNRFYGSGSAGEATGAAAVDGGAVASGAAALAGDAAFAGMAQGGGVASVSADQGASFANAGDGVASAQGTRRQHRAQRRAPEDLSLYTASAARAARAARRAASQAAGVAPDGRGMDARASVASAVAGATASAESALEQAGLDVSAAASAVAAYAAKAAFDAGATPEEVAAAADAAALDFARRHAEDERVGAGGGTGPRSVLDLRRPKADEQEGGVGEPRGAGGAAARWEADVVPQVADEPRAAVGWEEETAARDGDAAWRSAAAAGWQNSSARNAAAARYAGTARDDDAAWRSAAAAGWDASADRDADAARDRDAAWRSEAAAGWDASADRDAGTARDGDAAAGWQDGADEPRAAVGWEEETAAQGGDAAWRSAAVAGWDAGTARDRDAAAGWQDGAARDGDAAYGSWEDASGDAGGGTWYGAEEPSAADGAFARDGWQDFSAAWAGAAGATAGVGAVATAEHSRVGSGWNAHYASSAAGAADGLADVAYAPDEAGFPVAADVGPSAERSYAGMAAGATGGFGAPDDVAAELSGAAFDGGGAVQADPYRPATAAATAFYQGRSDLGGELRTGAGDAFAAPALVDDFPTATPSAADFAAGLASSADASRATAFAQVADRVSAVAEDARDLADARAGFAAPAASEEVYEDADYAPGIYDDYDFDDWDDEDADGDAPVADRPSGDMDGAAWAQATVQAPVEPVAAEAEPADEPASYDVPAAADEPARALPVHVGPADDRLARLVVAVDVESAVRPGAPGSHPEFDRLARTIWRLRQADGCPWDLAQTHASITRNMIEEAYEAVDAIRADDTVHLREELGDVLEQVLLHAQIAADAGEFTLDDVCRELNEKLVRRHPHVFGDAAGSAADADAALDAWDEVKRAEREAARDADVRAGLLDSVPHSLPALMQAQKISKRAAKVGFEWRDVGEVWEKVAEERAEFEAEPRGSDEAALEFGDLLFSLVNVARHEGIDAEEALAAACAKFRERWAAVEREAWRWGRDPETLSTLELNLLWDRAKR